MRRIVLLIGLMLAAVSTQAQNAIDKAVEEYSSIGRSKFTSAIERDPNTRKVLKVVKVLEPTDLTIDKLRKAFLKEKENGQFSTSTENDEETMVLTVETEKSYRVYMMHYKLEHPMYKDGKVTIIVKYKQ